MRSEETPGGKPEEKSARIRSHCFGWLSEMFWGVRYPWVLIAAKLISGANWALDL
jgi:hypothetical protein